MTAATVPPDELRALADAACDGDLSPAEAARLEALLRGSAEAQQFYLAYVRLDGCLRWEFGNRALGDGGSTAPEEERAGQEAPANAGTANGRGGTADAELQPGVARTNAAPLIHPSSFILHPFVTGTLLSYVAAALLLGAGVLAAWEWDIRGGRGAAPGVAAASPATQSSPEGGAGGKMERPCLGKIVPLTDCKWRAPQTLDSCCQRGCIELVAGTVEITYLTAAKVVIEGPALYIADSPNGGYLGVGRIKVVCPGASSTVRGGQPHPARPLFTLHTPNANFSTRDATLSIAGDISGECYAKVERGSVELTPLFDDLQRPISMHEGQSALTGLNVRGDPMVLVGKGEMPAIFARQMPKDLPALSIETIRDRARQRQKKGALPMESGAPDS